MTTNGTESSEREFITAQEVLLKLQDIVKQQVLGRDNIIELAIISLVADGHILPVSYTHLTLPTILRV